MTGIGEKIMVSAFTGVMGSLLGKLTKLMEEEYAKVKGVRKKVESLQKELITINVALEKYATIESPDVQVRAWMKDVREMAYNIEDCIDLFMYRVDHEPDDNTTGIKGLLRKSIRKLKKFKYRHRFAEKIQQLKALVNETYEQHVKYKIDDCNSGVMHTEIDLRLPALYVEVEKLVAIEGPSKQIISRFIHEESGPAKQHRVVSIVGSGGSGKTTLANQVYQKIRGGFSCSGFVSVSQKPIMVNILRDLLLEIENSDTRSDKYPSTGSYNEKHLIDRLRAHLENEKYLIVIDDIWSESAWEHIQCALPKNIHGSRIITTTRINNVAEFCCNSNGDFVYPMKPLSRSDSKKLFLKRSSVGADKCPNQLEGIMDEILHKCDGLPLAIVNIASLLANKPITKEEWERVRDSIGSVHGKDKELEVIDKILSLSYCDLPQPLKTCLLYFSMFPEDYIIGKYSLVWRWIAEGFIIPKHGYTLEEVGESYFNELVNRSLIQLEFKYDGEAISCRVHDIVLDFIVSRSIEENFVSILNGHHIPSPHNKIRRLYIQNKNEHQEEVSQQILNLSHLRSLNLFSSVTWMPPLLDLQILRVLYLEGCHALKDDQLENIGSLIHLRYLGLRNTKIKTLPFQIKKLECLQTLDLRGSGIRELPEAIVHLKRLRCLVGHRLRLPDGFGNMEALQELWEIDGSKTSINFGKDLQNLIQLRVLGVRFESSYCDEHQIRTALCKLGENNLRSLHIINIGCGPPTCFEDPWCPPPRLLQKFVLQGYRDDNFPWFPKWINSSLCELTYLDIGVDRMQGRDLHMLESLHALCVLCISAEEIPKEGLLVSRNGFQSLRHLCFHNIFGPGLIFEEGAMPKLQKLFLGFDADEAHSTYSGLGFGIQHLFSLNYIEVSINRTPAIKLQSLLSVRKSSCFPTTPRLSLCSNTTIWIDKNKCLKYDPM